jgi:hypothetical protein
MIISVINAELRDDYEVYVEFDNGAKGVIDFKKILEDERSQLMRDLLNKELFKTMKINLDTLCWDNDVDFAPDYLYEQVMAAKKVA